MPIAACAQKIEPGMTVVTEDDDLATWRKGIIELTLSEIGGDTCLSCEMHGPCDLHALAAEVGAEPGALKGATSAGPKLDDSNPFILRDYDQCIFCYRCTRVCGEHEQAHAIADALEADYVLYLDREGMNECARAGNPAIDMFCNACFTGDYPTGDVTKEVLEAIEGDRRANQKQFSFN